MFVGYPNIIGPKNATSLYKSCPKKITESNRNRSNSIHVYHNLFRYVVTCGFFFYFLFVSSCNTALRNQAYKRLGEISTFPVSSPTCDAIRFSQFKVKRERAVTLNTNPSQQSSELSFRRVTCTCTTAAGPTSAGDGGYFTIFSLDTPESWDSRSRRLWFVLSSKTGSPRWTMCRDFLPPWGLQDFFLIELANPVHGGLRAEYEYLRRASHEFQPLWLWHVSFWLSTRHNPISLWPRVCIDDCDIAGYEISPVRDRDRTS